MTFQEVFREEIALLVGEDYQRHSLRLQIDESPPASDRSAPSVAELAVGSGDARDRFLEAGCPQEGDGLVASVRTGRVNEQWSLELFANKGTLESICLRVGG